MAHLKFLESIVLFFKILFFLFFFFYTIELASFVTNFYNPDSVIIMDVINRYQDGIIGSSCLSSPLVCSLYSLISLENNFFYFFCFIINFIFLYYAFKEKTIYILFFFPFLISCIFFPSKDILAITLSVIFVVSFIKKQYILIALSLLTLFFIRAPYSLFLFITVPIIFLFINNSYFINEKKIHPLLVCTSLCFCFIIGSLLLPFFSNLPLISKFFNSVHFDVSTNYFYNIVGNIFKLPFRSLAITDEGKIPLIGILFFLTGVSYLSVLLYGILQLKKMQVRSLAIFLIPGLMIIFFSSFPIVQPRYIFPGMIIFFYYEILSSNSNIKYFKKIYFIIFFLSFLVNIVQIIFGNSIIYGTNNTRLFH